VDWLLVKGPTGRLTRRSSYTGEGLEGAQNGWLVLRLQKSCYTPHSQLQKERAPGHYFSFCLGIFSTTFCIPMGTVMQNSPPRFPANFAFFQPWNHKENFMTKLAYVVVTTLILMASGCSSMGETTGFAGDSTNLSHSDLYSGGTN
jgi:hypothetical protein